MRGGSWNDNARNVRSAARNAIHPADRNDNVGFRLAREQKRVGRPVSDPTIALSVPSFGRRKPIERRRVSRKAGVQPNARRCLAFFLLGLGEVMTTSTLPHPLDLGNPPSCACEWGEDRHGVFFGFAVADVVTRMRWIPPGTFLMGSPDSEAGRFGGEGPVHEVQLTKGFWLAETPCTQALWQAVTGENPSRYRTPGRPVESVSWNECREFLTRLSERVDGLFARLPTEAEWEYACRAGTVASTYAGELEIRGHNDAPLLDRIAWYGGNSGVGYDLEDGFDSSSWPDKQHRHSKAGTREVGLKQPNDWGLFDMLGNVWEWCADWYGPYEPAFSVDPTGLYGGTLRVVRGGSWDDVARSVRSAARGAFLPAVRFVFVGFRLARGQSR